MNNDILKEIDFEIITSEMATLEKLIEDGGIYIGVITGLARNHEYGQL